MKFNFEATGIGSVPFNSAKSACQIIFDNFQDIPFWPQLPKISFRENMYVQFSERLPGAVLDENARTIHIDTSRAVDEMETGYGKYLEGDVDYFAVSEDYAAGFYEFLKVLESGKKVAPKFAKGQVTGPVSFALSLHDQTKRPVIYDKDMFDVITKVIVMKARWQIKMLKTVFPNVIIFIDEPYLVSIGSSYVTIDAAGAMESINEVARAIRSDGALSGIHCCGNTDWGALLKKDIDILSFDAYNFIKEFTIYQEELKSFLKDGGTIAWGIVPSSDQAGKETVKALAGRLDDAVGLLTGRGVEEGIMSSIVTPSCGLGTLNDEAAKSIFGLTKTVSRVYAK